MTAASSTLQGFRLSAQQRLTWAVEPGAVARCTVALAGDPDPVRLRRAFAEVMARHEILRTRFHRRPGMRYPLQVVTGEPGADGEEAFRLTSRGDGRHELAISLPALCTDARTLANVVEELARLYGGAPVAALGEPVQYADFSEWQTGLLEPGDEETEQGKAFWEGRSAPAEPLDLPFALPAGEEDEEPRTAAVEVALPAALADWPAERLLAAWAALLARTGGRDRISLAVAFEGRIYEEIEGSCGPFAKLLPVRAETGPGLPFETLAGALGAVLREAGEFQQYFDWERHAPEGLPEAGFALVTAPPPPAGGGVTFTLESLRVPLQGVRLALCCLRVHGGLRTEILFAERAFAAADVHRLASRLAALAASAGAGGSLGELDILGPEEREEVLTVHQGARRERPGASVPERFAAWAARQPDAPALVWEERTLTYAELDAAANRLAHHLRRLGAGAGTPVALCLDRSADGVVALLAALKAGAAFAFLEPAQPRERLAAMLDDLAPPVIITRSELAAFLPAHPARKVLLDGDAEAVGRESGAAPAVSPTPEDLAYVVFTSGSTGRPKGVAVEHRQLSSYLDGIAERLAAPAGASYATVSTFAADLGHTAIFPALCGGGCLHVVPHRLATDAAGLAAYVRERGVGVLKIVPGHLQALMAGDGAADVLPRHRLVTGGEALRWPLVERIQALAPGLDLLNHYGPSETTVGVLTHRPLGEPRDARTRTVPLGRPLAGVRCYLLDERLEPVPFWTPGELAVAGASVARGYFGRPDLTAERFVPDPFGERFGEPGARLYRTGDLARRLPGGEIEFLGRVDDQVKFNGFRVELGEIRGALARHPEVSDCVVVARRDANDQTALIAFYVSRRELDAAGLRSFLAGGILEETLPGYFVRLPKLPRTLNGKVDPAALPGLDEIRRSARRGFTPPRTPVEELIAAVWAELLGLERVSVHESFFELGGHSLLATQLISRLRQVFGVDVPLRVLFEEPTLAGLAARVESLAQGGAGVPEAIGPAPREGRLPLSYAQERMWFLYQLEPESPAYNSARAFRVHGRIDRRALERALAEVVRRHESLRTTFDGDDEGQAWQVIAAGLPVEVPVVDLVGLPAGAREGETGRLLGAGVRRPFDLVRGPLMRILLLRYDTGEHMLVFAMHHIAADAWSRGVFIRELITAYAAFAGQEDPGLAPLPLQYADFAVWQRRWMAGERLEGELAYWKRQLAGASGRLDLPTDFPRPPFQTFRGGQVVFDLSPGQAEQVAGLSRREGVTPFMALLAVFLVFLQRASGQDDLSVGTDIANRNRAELEGLIGLFVNNVVLRVSLAGDPPFRELLRRVREVTLGAYAHQDLPFDRLVTALRPRRDPARTPLFQVLFVAQNVPLPPLELPGLRLEPVEIDTGMCKFDLAVFVSGTGGRLSMTWNYSTDLFSEATIRRLEGHFEKLLESAQERPGAPLGELQMLTASEKERLAMERTEREEANVLRLRGARRRSAGGGAPESLVRTELPEGATCP